MKKLKLITLSLFVITCLLNAGYAQNFYEINKLVANDRGASDAFGISVSVSNDYAIIGALFEDEDTSGISGTLSGAGAAYIFEKSVSGKWEQTQKLVASDREIDDRFGTFVSISGNYAIIGAPQEDEDTAGIDSMLDAGAAYIFERSLTGVWNQVQKIVASDREAGDLFGKSVAISGNYAIIGADEEDEDTSNMDSLSNAGSAYIFERSVSGKWEQVQKIVAPSRAVDDFFGFSVSISDNLGWGYVIVGAYREDEDTLEANTLSRAGSAYIFERDSIHPLGAGVWELAQKIVASDRATLDEFGTAVSISNNYAIVSAPREAEDENGLNTMSTAGSAYIFERLVSGKWEQIQKIVASDRQSSTLFGNAVSISENYIAVGAAAADYPILNAGAAYIFKRSDSTANWSQMQKIVHSDYASNNDNFGYSIAISGDYILVGAKWEDEDTAGVNILANAGSAYMFQYICQSSSSMQNIVSCGSYPLPSGNGNYTISGTYIDTIPNSIGCDSFITIDLVINTVDTSVSSTGSVLTSNATGATYQWIYCFFKNVAVAGAVNQSFTPTTEGTYAVVVTQNGCTDTSNCHMATVLEGTSIEENVLGDLFVVYPNPTFGAGTIELGRIYNNITIKIINVIGQIISTNNYQETNRITFDIQGKSGVYFVEVAILGDLSINGWPQVDKMARIKIMKN